MSDWIKNLKAGDIVIVSSGQIYGQSNVKKIDRITPSGRIVIGEITFNQDGQERTQRAYGNLFLVKPTQELLEDIHEKETINKARNLMMNYHKINYDQAVEIVRVLGDKG